MCSDNNCFLDGNEYKIACEFDFWNMLVSIRPFPYG